MDTFFSIDTWQWWMFGILLILAEGLIPQTFLLWIGLSAVFTGSITYVKPNLGTLTAILIFILTSGVISSFVRRLGYNTSKNSIRKSAPKAALKPAKTTSQKAKFKVQKKSKILPKKSKSSSKKSK